MGFFKKIFRGVKKVFKKIGRGIKKVVGKVGKFMNKIGIVGQIAMAFILPGIGNALMNGVGGIASSMVTNTLGGIGGALVRGAGHVVSAAHKFVTVGKNAFNTVTQGVTKFVGEFGKTALNKIPGVNIQSASKNFFGSGGAWETVQQDIVKNAGNIVNPFRSSVDIKQGMNIKDVVNTTGVSKNRIQEMNIGLDLDNLKVGDKINFDANSIGTPMTGDQVKELTGIDLGGTTPRPTPNYGSRNISPTYNALDPANIDPNTGNIIPQSTTTTGPFTQAEMDKMNLGYDSSQYTQPSILTSPNVSAATVPDVPKTFLQKAGDELKNRYNFDETPLAGAAIAAGDIQDVSQLIDPETLEYGSGYSTPVYMGTGSQDMDVMVPTAQRNFNAYSNMGQYGSTSRIYDTILMNPVSTWSRDLSSRFS